MDHVDEIGVAMYKRFEAAYNNPLITKEELDKVSISPYMLQPHLLVEECMKANELMSMHGIDRKLQSTYICHWKDVFIKQGIIHSSSLTFQEDDAPLYTTLHCPNPVKDWSAWGTLTYYCLKMYTSASETALNLYRGVTRQRITDSKKKEER